MNEHVKTEQTMTLNSNSLMKAVAIAMFNCGKLEKEQRQDIILAALDAFKTSIVDDLTHHVGIGEVPDQEVIARLVDLGLNMEEIRRERISRFGNLCELLKPDVNIIVSFDDRKKGDKLDA